MLNVGLVQINNRFSGQSYLPLSVGMIQAYIEKSAPGKYNFLLPIYAREKVDAAVEKLMDADVVFFSIYVWNERISLEIARRLKAKKPATLIVFGGPQVPDRNGEFLAKNLLIDAACHGEGERSALSVLNALKAYDPECDPPIEIWGTRSKDLTAFPSPYLSGTFDALMAANPNEKWIGLWETNRGCPWSCRFCDWGSAVASKVYQFDTDRLYAEVDWFADHRIEFVFCCDANFGILPRDVDLARYIADVKGRRSYPHAMSVQATKNATERAYQTQKILADAGLSKGIDIALQSSNPEVLKAIARDNISTETYRELQRRFSKDGIETYTDLILGLPNETYDSFANTVDEVISNGQHNRIQFNNLSILPNAEMGNPEYQKKYGMVTVETPALNVHGVQSDEEIPEMQVLVIATNTMSLADWRRTRVFAWMVSLLHFDKLLQIPLIVLHEQAGVRYRDMVELFLNSKLTNYPTLRGVRKFFRRMARTMQLGGPEYKVSTRWLPIGWPADEYVFIDLSISNKLTRFYSEAERLLRTVAHGRIGLLAEAVMLNRDLMKQPHVVGDIQEEYMYNLWEYYQSVIRGNPVPLVTTPTMHTIDRSSQYWRSWNDWAENVVWYGNKKGAYLYGAQETKQLEGHF